MVSDPAPLLKRVSARAGRGESLAAADGPRAADAAEMRSEAQIDV